MSKIADLLDRFVAPASRVGKWLAMIALAGSMFLVTADVLGRYALNKPIKGTDELVEMAMVILVFLALAYSVSKGGSIVLTILTDKFGRRAKAIMGIVTAFMGLVFVCLLTWESFVRGRDVLRYGQVTGAIEIPIYPFVFVMALGLAILGLKLIADFIRSLKPEVQQ